MSGPTYDIPSYRNLSCAEVCKYGTYVFDPTTSNLETCGLWTTVSRDFTFTSSSPENLTPFLSVGLKYNTSDESQTYVDVITACFQVLSIAVKSTSFQGSQTLPSACTPEVLFTRLQTNLSLGGLGEDVLGLDGPNTTLALQACVEQVCSPRRLNSDLAGIGVGNAQ